MINDERMLKTKEKLDRGEELGNEDWAVLDYLGFCPYKIYSRWKWDLRIRLFRMWDQATEEGVKCEGVRNITRRLIEDSTRNINFLVGTEGWKPK